MFFFKNKKKLDKDNQGQIATDSMLLVLVRCITMSVSIIQTMILTRMLSKADYGTYSQALLVISFFTPFFSLGLENAINYFFNKSNTKETKEMYVNTVFALSIFSGLMCGILILCFKDYISDYFDNPAILGVMVYIAFRPCLQNVIILYQPLFISSGYAKTIAVRNFIISLAQICILGGVSYFTKDVTLIFALLLILDMLQLICFALIYKKRNFTINLLKPNISLIKGILKYALPMLISTSIGTISINMDKIMISGMMNVEDYALYSNVSKELPFAFIVSSFTAVVMPIIIKYINSGELDKFKKLWVNYLELGYKVTWPLCIGAAFLSPELIEVLYSQKYLSDDGIFVFVLYTIVAMLRFTYFGMVPSALGKTNIVLKYSAIGCGINLVLNYPMFLLIGMPGPAIATVVSMGISAALYFIASTRLSKIAILEVLDIKKIGLLFLEMIMTGILLRNFIFVIKIFTENVFIIFIVGYILYNVIIFGINSKGLKKLLSNMNKENI